MSAHTPKPISPDGLVEVVQQHLEPGARLGIAADYDGTLISLRPRPGDGVAGDELVGLMKRLGRHPRLDVAVITGRSLEDLHGVLPLATELFLFGGHGGEGEGPGHRAFCIHSDPAAVRLLRQIGRRLSDTRWPDEVWLEDKGLALALHVLAATPEDRHAAQARFTDEVVKADHHHRLRVSRGKRALEVLPKHLHKGLAIRWLGEKLSPPPDVWLALGDDEPDEALFAEVGERGLGVLVGEDRPSAARYRLRDHKKALAFLEKLEAALPASAPV